MTGITKNERKRVLMIGAGRRAVNNFLPVLTCLQDAFEIVGIHARTEERLRPIAEKWKIPAILRLQDVDFAGVDVVAVSVPLDQNAAVLNQLKEHAPNIDLVIDTPVAGNLRQMNAVLPLLSRFRRILAAEDYMNFPHFRLMRTMVNDGVLGQPRAITLYNAGYQYHGLALIRSFVGFAPALMSGRSAAGSFSVNTHYRFMNGFRAQVIGPYRPHINGGVVLEGTKGVLTESDSDAASGNTKGMPVYRLVKLFKDGELSGFSIEGQKKLYELELPAMQTMRAMDIADKSDLNLLRGCGLMEIFGALNNPQDFNHSYGVQNAIYDSFVSKLATRGLLPVDPFVFFGHNVVRGLRYISGII